MGFFSKTCAKTHLPVVHNMRGYPELCNVVALLKDGGKVEGEYDGYGNVGVLMLLVTGIRSSLFCPARMTMRGTMKWVSPEGRMRRGILCPINSWTTA